MLFKYLLLLAAFLGALAADVSISKDISTAIPDLFEEHKSFGLGREYDDFRATYSGLSVVSTEKQQEQEHIRKERKLTVSNIFEIQHTLSFDGSLIYARGYALDLCVCGFNATSGSSACSYITAAQVGTSNSYTLTVQYFNGTSRCLGTPLNTVVTNYAPSSLPYQGCSGKTYQLLSSYAITTPVSYLFYPTGLVTFHYGSAASCNGGTDFTDYKFSGFTSCGEGYLPCFKGTNTTTYYAINYNSIGIKTYSDGSCSTETSVTQITATANCYPGTFDDDIGTSVVQNYYSWYVQGYPLDISVSTGVTLSKKTYGGLVAAVFIAFLVGIAITTCAFYFHNRSASKPMARREDNARL